MSIATQITRLQNAKADIKTAIEAKGVTVPSSAKLDTYDTYVAQISGGGGTSKLPEVVDRSVTTLSASDLGNITTIGHSAFRNCGLLTSITIPNSVMSIESYAFNGCASLTSITIPNAVENIGTYAFANCRGLTNITIGNSVINIRQNAFNSCISLTSITIPDSVRSLEGSVFSSCSNLVTATFGTGVTTIPSTLFKDCINLTTVTINGDITKLSGYCFQGCASLTNLSSLPTTLTSIENDVFKYCSLTALDYQGPMAQWNAISKDSNWNRDSALTTIHCSDGDITL